ncbi:hypothetical protein B296_00006390 [Ensete ventricosum]|uniref:Uncharacterized protein n=1 Tax=Ensete ventricosum TaxID=4639 RepID=A0A426ZBX8_ENSVE|nr:hypothetical protein B296_00006390 [Ensete ventricosum]
MITPAQAVAEWSVVGPRTLRPFPVPQLCTRSLPSSFDLDSFVLLRTRFCLAFPYISDSDLDSGAGSSIVVQYFRCY